MSAAEHGADRAVELEHRRVAAMLDGAIARAFGISRLRLEVETTYHEEDEEPCSDR